MDVVGRDPESFCRRQWLPLAQSLAAYTGDVVLGQDLAQESLARVLARWPRVRRMRSPGGYAYRIGVNLARDALRERRRGRDRDADAPCAAETDPTTRLALDTAVASLPPRQRLAVCLRYLADLSVTETADVMGCRPGTVKALCHQATRTLQVSPQLDWHHASPLQGRIDQGSPPMADIREQLRTTAPLVEELDLPALRARAAQIRAADQRRSRAVFAGVAAALCVALVSVVMLNGGGDLGIADFDGEPLILFGWADWCGWCVDEGLPLLGNADTVGVRVVGLAADANVAAARDALNAEHEIVDTFVGPLEELRIRTLANRAITRTDPDLSVTVNPSPEPTIGAGEPTAPADLPPSPPIDPDCTPTESIYVVQPADTLSIIADTVYGDPTLFGPIAEAKNLQSDAPMTVGQRLRIPGCQAQPPVNVPATANPRPILDPDLHQAITDSAPEGWHPRPTTVPKGIAFGDADGGIVIQQVPVAEDATSQTLVQDAIDLGAARIDLPDGAVAAFTNPPITGHLLVPLPGGRLIQISGEGDLAESLDYEIGTVQSWMTAVRAILAS
ncbi:MAG: sigma-70 family RNA polymerase sigma factor [Euzebya sp.]